MLTYFLDLDYLADMGYFDIPTWVAEDLGYPDYASWVEDSERDEDVFLEGVDLMVGYLRQMRSQHPDVDARLVLWGFAASRTSPSPKRRRASSRA